MRNDQIAIRSIQHYMYCPHRWGLLEIDRAWAENVFVTKANLMHQRVHDPDKGYFSRGKKVLTSLQVYNDQEPYQLYGVVDCLELTEGKDGVFLDGEEKTYHLCIVEYKPTRPKKGDFREEDLMQVFAQKLCVDAIFGSDCRGEIYYGDVKKRVSLPLKENFSLYEKQLRNLLKEMRGYLEMGVIPPIRKGQKCSGCSMKDLCMPGIKRVSSVREEIEKIRSMPL